jgi:hypothetical protein
MASRYERQTGGVTRTIARAILSTDMTPRLTSHSTIHDNACGTGIVTDGILNS